MVFKIFSALVSHGNFKNLLFKPDDSNDDRPITECIANNTSDSSSHSQPSCQQVSYMFCLFN